MNGLLRALKPATLFLRLKLYLSHSEGTGILVLAVTVGLLTGLGVRLFRLFIDIFDELFNHQLVENTLEPIIGAFALIASLALAGALVGFIVDRFIGEEKHHGVAGIIESVLLAGGRLKYRKMPSKSLVSALSLGAGASVGPEDPSVQIGANIGSWIGQKLRLTESSVRIMVAAGAAGAIAAAFKAPVAGVFFALEVVLTGAFTTGSISVVVLAAVVSSGFMEAVSPMREVGPFSFTLISPLEIPLFIPLGLLLAPIAILFIRYIYWQHDFWHDHIHLSRPIRTALTGATVGAVGIFLPELLGGGSHSLNEVLGGHAHFTFLLLLALGIGKMLLTGLSIAGGFVGGVFAPTLFVGTMLGAAYGQLIESLLGSNVIGDPQAYAIAGMAGMLAGVVRSPITAIMLVFELTNDYRLILPIMLTAAVCVVITERFIPGIYRFGLLRSGIHLQEGREIDMMQGVLVKEAMLAPPPVIRENASLIELRDTLRNLHTLSICVLDAEEKLVGIVTLSDLQRIYEQAGEDKTIDLNALTVGEICTHDVLVVNPDDVLWEAIRTMSSRDVGRVPVVEPGTQKVVGIIGRHGVMRAYNIALARKLQDQHVAERVRLNNLTGAHVYEFRISGHTPLTGKYIKDVKWPAESVVASIQRNGKLVVPHGSTLLRNGDIIAIVADPKVLHDLEVLLGKADVN